MINAKKLVKLARKWQKLAALKRKRITVPNTITPTYTNNCITSGKSEKGYFVVYSTDQKRFSLPLDHLNNELIRELFNMAEEEFGLQGSGPLTLPCEGEFMEYAIALIKQKVNRDVESALLTSIATRSCSFPFDIQNHVASHQLAVCGF